MVYFAVLLVQEQRAKAAEDEDEEHVDDHPEARMLRAWAAEQVAKQRKYRVTPNRLSWCIGHAGGLDRGGYEE